MRLIRRLRNHLRFRRSGQAIMLLSGLLVAVIGLAANFIIWHARQTAFDEHQRSMHSMGVVLAEQTERYVQVIDLIVQAVQSQTAILDIETPADFKRRMGSRSFQAFLVERVKNVPQANAIVLIDADGQLLNSSRAWPLPPVDARGRDYYLYFKQNADSNLFIGSMSQALVSGKLSLFFARRVSGPDGQFLGLIVGVVDVDYLNDFYRAATAHLGEAVTLLRSDGAILMRYPNPASALGVKLPQGSPWYTRVTEGGGSYVTPGSLDAIPALVSVHPLDGYPLVVDIVMDERLVFAEWRVEAAYVAGIAFAIAFAFISLFWALSRQFQKLAEQNTRLEEGAVSLCEGQQRLRAYAEMSSDWFWEQDANLRFKFNSIVPFGVTSDDIGKVRRDLGDPAMHQERWLKHEAQLTARSPFRNFRWERIGSDGQRHFMSTNGDPVFDSHGVFVGYRGTGREMTGEVQANARLVEAITELEIGRLQMDAVMSNITHGVCLFDGDQRLLVWNRRYIEIYNLPPDAARVGRSLREIVAYRVAAGTADVSQTDHLVRRAADDQPAGRIVTLENGRIVVIHDQPMSDGGWVSTHEDVTDRQRVEASIAFTATHDALTRLANRVLFQDRLDQAIAMAEGSDFAVIYLDLDHFKPVNDSFGHPVGDGLLQAVANRLQACVREGDTVARLGGDEFAIIQLATGQAHHAEVLTARILAAFRDPFVVKGHQIEVGISMGVALAPGDGTAAETLLKNADIALYLAKTEGRGTVRFFEPEMDTRIQLHRTLGLNLRGAIARNEFELYYQPLINLVGGKIIGFEALLRWHHPVRGLVSPADFIPIAEETGLIVAIGEWVLRTACFEAENWPADISVAVNLSPVQFKKGSLIATVREALAASGLRPDRLELEITESVLLQDTAGTLAALHELRSMGIAVALDDFGTGYSSLSYLRSFPFDKIKIDQSFVRDLERSKESMSIIRAVTGLGHSLNIKTTAEGVETLEQLYRLRDEGCTEAQGYLFSHPRPASELPLLIERLQQVGKGTFSHTLKRSP
jgi:diguanylate cyclase (GGDEF)-like protein